MEARSEALKGVRRVLSSVSSGRARIPRHGADCWPSVLVWQDVCDAMFSLTRCGCVELWKAHHASTYLQERDLHPAYAVSICLAWLGLPRLHLRVNKLLVLLGTGEALGLFGTGQARM